MSNAPDLGGYVEVKDRIAAFREKHPQGTLRPYDPAQPYTLEALKVGDDQRLFIVYTAAAYRSPDDALPGIGVAWEPFPGLTPYTRNSELMNAETSAWGRAIVAALAADASAIATAEDVRNRSAEKGEASRPATALASDKQVKAIWATARAAGLSDEDLRAGVVKAYHVEHLDRLTAKQASELIDRLKAKEVRA